MIISLSPKKVRQFGTGIAVFPSNTRILSKMILVPVADVSRIVNLPLLQRSEWDADQIHGEDLPCCTHYSIEWRVTLNNDIVVIFEFGFLPTLLRLDPRKINAEGANPVSSHRSMIRAKPMV